MNIRAWIVINAAACMVSAAGVAGAQPPAVDGGAVESRFLDGVARARAGDYEGASRSFAEAYAIRPMPRILLNLALCEEKLGKLREALEHYNAVIQESATGDDDRADAKRHVVAMRAKGAFVEVRTMSVPQTAKVEMTRIAVSGGLLLLGAAAWTAAIVFGLDSATESSRASWLREKLAGPTTSNSYCAGVKTTDCAELDSDSRASSSDRDRAIYLGVASGALVGAGIATWLMWPRAVHSIAIIPRFGPGRAGASFTLSY
jgi:hypothetical protein